MACGPAFEYESGRLATIVDPAGRATHFNVDVFGNLLEITDPDGSSRQFQYDDRHHMVGEITQRGFAESVVFDQAGRVASVTRRDQSEKQFQPAQVRGLYPSTATNDPFQAPRAAASVGGDTFRTDGLGNVTYTQVDGGGKLLAERDSEGALPSIEWNADLQVVSLTDARGNLTSFTYDDRGNLLTVSDSISGAASQVFTYHERFNRPVTGTDELGRLTLFDVDPVNGDLLSITTVVGAVGGGDDITTSMTYTPEGLVETLTDPLGRIQQVNYNPRGLVNSVIYALGTPEEAEVRYEYDAAGNLAARIDELGHRYSYVYDELNRLRTVIQPDPDGPGPLSRPVTRIEYDRAGNATKITDGLGNVERFEYDPLDRLVVSTTATQDVYQYEFDLAGNVVAEIDPLGFVETSEYDSRNRLVRSVDPTGAITRFEYDQDNNPTLLVNPKGNATSFEFDARNRLTTETDPYGRSIVSQYDAVNNLESNTDREGRQRTFVFDELNRMVTETWVGDGNVLQFEYDAVGNLLSASDSSSQATFQYDARNRVTDFDNQGSVGAPRVVLHYEYDAVGNRTLMREVIDGAAGAATEYQYDNLDRLTRINQADMAGVVAEKRFDFSYDVLSNLLALDRYADVDGLQPILQTRYQYDALDRVRSIVHGDAATPLAFLQLDYDAASRVIRREDANGDSLYLYDERDQLLGADRQDPAVADETYGYDDAGNRTESSLHGDSYNSDAGNRLQSDGEYVYEYDGEGNLMRRVAVADGAKREYFWDYRNRLVMVVDRNGADVLLQQVEFTYDALNRKILKEVTASGASSSTHFVSDELDTVLEFVDSDGSTGPASPEFANRNVFGPAVDQILAIEDAAGQTIWTLTDELGSVTDLIDETGQVLNHIKYDAYGGVVGQSNPTVTSRYLFTGREYDADLDLYDYRGRYYDPSVGRFLSEDPLGLRGDDYNLYAYVANAPTLFVDPMGLKAQAAAKASVKSAPGAAQAYAISRGIPSTGAWGRFRGIIQGIEGFPGFLLDSLLEGLARLLDGQMKQNKCQPLKDNIEKELQKLADQLADAMDKTDVGKTLDAIRKFLEQHNLP